jgi:hypothetical protein
MNFLLGESAELKEKSLEERVAGCQLRRGKQKVNYR